MVENWNLSNQCSLPCHIFICAPLNFRKQFSTFAIGPNAIVYGIKRKNPPLSMLWQLGLGFADLKIWRPWCSKFGIAKQSFAHEAIA
jgi:hypothetical protein